MLGSGEFSATVFPHKVIPAVIRCGPAYFLGMVPFALIALFAIPFDFSAIARSPATRTLIGLLTSHSLLSILAFALTVGLITATCSLYITLMQARMTGLIARRYRDEIANE